jgi:hypothetical protein
LYFSCPFGSVLFFGGQFGTSTSVSAIAAVYLSSSRSLSPDYSTRRPPTLPLLSFEVEVFFSLGVCLFGSSLCLSV